jgi:hypothetical protein
MPSKCSSVLTCHNFFLKNQRYGRDKEIFRILPNGKAGKGQGKKTTGKTLAVKAS